ncbi:GNAT family N-acetyltransferase [Piscirickettsia litoralis]|nr:GNAT family protein [Piscirickettsia litoralis]
MKIPLDTHNLQGSSISLEKLDNTHRKELKSIALEPSHWTYFPYSITAESFDDWFNKALEKTYSGTEACMVVRANHSGNLVGSSRFYEVDLAASRLSIGHTFYSPEARGTITNPECKLLMLTHAFETLQLERVEFKADSRNVRSLAALKKLGATKEGTLRKHMTLANGYTRDSVVFSILKTEWFNTVKVNLLTRIEK